MQNYERKLFIKSFLSNSLSKIFITNVANDYNAMHYSHLLHSKKVFRKKLDVFREELLSQWQTQHSFAAVLTSLCLL